MDCSDPERERTYTRPVAAEMLIDAGATVERKTWEHVIRTGAVGNAAPARAKKRVAADAARSRRAWRRRGGSRAAGGIARARRREDFNEQTVIGRALMTACRFKHTDIALRLLERSIALDPDLGRRIDRWQGRKAFVEFLTQQPGLLWHETRDDAVGDVRDSVSWRARATATICPRSAAGSTTNRGCSNPRSFRSRRS